LFPWSFSLAEAGLPVVLLERGQPVERRGRDIGALFARSELDPESNLCFGEGVHLLQACSHIREIA